MRTTRWFISTVAMILGVISLAFAASEGQEDASSSIAVWTFLGLCALIVVGQLLPAFRAMRPPEKIAHQQVAEAHATDEGSQVEPAVGSGREQ